MTFPMPTFMPAASVNPAVLEASAATSAGNTSSATLNLPSSIASGELLLLFVALLGTAARTLTTPSGWTQQIYVIGPGNLRRLAVYSKTATGSEGSTVGLTASGSSDFKSVAVRISNWTSVEFGSTSSGTSTSADASAVSPSWGSAPNLYLADVGYLDDVEPSAPSGFSRVNGVANLVWYGNAGNTLFSLTETSASNNPGAATLDVSCDWAAVAAAVQGA